MHSFFLLENNKLSTFVTKIAEWFISVLRLGNLTVSRLMILCLLLCLFVGCSDFQPISPVRAEVDVKLGGTQCNIIMSRLKPWLHLHHSKKKKMVLREETSTPVRSLTTESKVIMWTCTVSAPEMTIVLYSINGLPLYQVSYVHIKLLNGIEFCENSWALTLALAFCWCPISAGFFLCLLTF